MFFRLHERLNKLKVRLKQLKEDYKKTARNSEFVIVREF